MVTVLWARRVGELDDLVGKVTGFTWVKHEKLAMPRGGDEMVGDDSTWWSDSMGGGDKGRGRLLPLLPVDFDPSCTCNARALLHPQVGYVVGKKFGSDASRGLGT